MAERVAKVRGVHICTTAEHPNGPVAAQESSPILLYMGNASLANWFSSTAGLNSRCQLCILIEQLNRSWELQPAEVQTKFTCPQMQH